MADTVKVQWNAYLGEGQLLLSDQGRVLASVIADTSGRHDALCGTSSLVRNTERYGDGTPQSAPPPGASCSSWPPPRTAWSRATCRRPSPSSRAWRYARTAPWTSPVRPVPGGSVTLRAEQDVTVLIANVPHPADPRDGLHRARRWRYWPGAPRPPASGDPLWDATPEGRRAFLNTAEFLAARGIA